MVHKMESQLQNVLASPVFEDDEIKVSGMEEEQADVFIEHGQSLSVEEEKGEVLVRMLDVPKWLSNEAVAVKCRMFRNCCSDIKCVTRIQHLSLTAYVPLRTSHWIDKETKPLNFLDDIPLKTVSPTT